MKNFSPQIGSDEVGVGDFFGPIIFSTCYLDADDLEFLSSLNIRDSKKLTDSYILKVGSSLVQHIRHHTIVLPADKLSDLQFETKNIHIVMAEYHNKAQKCLIEKYELSPSIPVFIDQFTPEHLYRKFVGNRIIPNPLTFKTHGESSYLPVAVSSMLARYEFLRYWMNMEKVLGIDIPKGTNNFSKNVYLSLRNSGKKKLADQYVKRFFTSFKKMNT